MNPTVRKILLVLLAVICLGCAVKVGYQIFQYDQGDKTYAEAEALVDLPDLSSLPAPTLPQVDSSSSSSSDTSSTPEPVYVDPYADALRNMDFTALREVNDDILGWILIPDTKISYPLVQGDDNEYYLNRTWRKTRNSVGAIFMECQNSSDLSDFNTIIYGHRMNNSSMFGILKSFKNQSFWASHPYVYITDDNGSHRYEIFAAYEVSVEGDTYRLGFSSDASKQSFIDYCLSQSVIDTGITPTVYDRILTLSTCTGNGHATRWVVQAVLKGEAPSDSAQNTQPEEPASTSTDSSQPADTPASSGNSSATDSSTSQTDPSAQGEPDVPSSSASTSQQEDSSSVEPPRISQDIRPDPDEEP